MNTKTMKEVAMKFFAENGDILVKVGGAAAVAILYKKLGIRFNDPFGFNFTTSSGATAVKPAVSTTTVITRNATEAAIFSIYNSAKTMSFDSNKCDAARQIRDILSKDGVDDGTKQFGIHLLDKLSATMDFDSNKRYISSIITKLV